MTNEVEYFRSGTTFAEFCREFFADAPGTLETNEARAFMKALDRVAVEGGESLISPRLDPRFILAATDWLGLNATTDDEFALLISTQESQNLEVVANALPFVEKREAFYEGPGSWLDEITDAQVVDEYFDNADFLPSLGGTCRFWRIQKDGAKRRVLLVDF